MSVLAKEIEATYEVLTKMGEGGMGAVYKVRHRFFDEVRVIKVMQTDLADSPELTERFVGEAKRGKLLRHPNLAEVIDFSITPDGTAYIVMEYIEGVNLREMLTRNGGPLDYRTVIAIAEQALDALGFLHSRRFVHRDISPDNLMLTKSDGPEPRVKLIDLGIAKSLEAKTQLTMVGKFIGKVNYASPEQYGGRVDGRSDLYSLGVVLYELLTGVKPIAGHDTSSVMAGHLTRPPKPFETTDPEGRVPPLVRAAVLKALAKDASQRFQTAAEFADALRAAVAPGELHTIAVPGFTQPMAVDHSPFVPTVQDTVAAQDTVVDTRAATRSRKPLWIAAAVVILAAAALIAYRFGGASRFNPPEVTTATTTAGGLKPAAPQASVEVPAVVENGQLLINALPWGQVTSVRDASGRERLTAPAETPLVLTLPAGQYKVQLTNPNSNRSRSLTAIVKANDLSRYEAELDQVDAGDYVNSLGIGQ